MVSDPTQFWQNSAMGKKAKAEVITKEPYVLPDQKGSDGQNVFRALATYMLQTQPSEFQKGYLELDKVYQTSTDVNIKAYRDQLIKVYPTPFCGRRAYLFKIELDKIKETTPTGIVERKTLSKLKAVQGKDSFFFQGRVCAFKNTKELSIADENVVQGPEGEVIREDAEDGGFKYLYCGIFSPTDVLAKVTAAVKATLDKDPEGEVYGFFLATRIGKKKKDDGTGFWYSIDADDVFFL